MSRSGFGILIIAVLLIGGVGALILQEFRESTSFGDHQLSPWRNVGRRIGPGTVTVEVRSLTPPLPCQALPISQTNRETLLDTWISLQSHIAGGKDNSDLQAYLSHYYDSEGKWGELCKRGLITPTAAFDALRHANARLEVIGIIRLYSNYILACRFQQGQSATSYGYTYVPFIKRSDGFYCHAFNDRQLLQVNRLLMADGYREITHPGE